MANRASADYLAATPKSPLAAVLSGARAVTAYLVQRIDRRDEYYYLIIMQRQDQPTAIVRIDGLNGTFLGALSLIGATYSPIITPDAAIAAARQAVIDCDDGRGRIILRDGAFSLHRTLVWRPSAESRSPYYPFYQMAVGGDTIYVGCDGRIYPCLHDLGHG